MGNSPDPNLYWDGQKWLRWDGYAWQPVQTQPTQPPAQPTQLPPHQYSQTNSKKLPTGAVVAICAGVAFILIVLGSGATYLLTKNSTTTSSNTESVTVQTEPVSTSNNPFTPPITPQGATTTDTAVSKPVTTSSPITVKGGQVGLYGGTEKVSQCDKAKLVTFLQQSPAKAKVWAEVEGIDVSDIPTFVNKLTQVVLRSDTLVTNHGWENNKMITFPSVLQYGTAVLVNSYGLPVVKCYCGNPLTAASLPPKPTYTGSTWSGWNTQSITVIQTNITVIQDFTLINVITNQSFGRPTGTDGLQDGPPPTQSESPTPTSSESPTPTASSTVPPSPTPTITSGVDAAAFAKAAVLKKLKPCALAKGATIAQVDALTWQGKATADPNVWSITATGPGGSATWQVNSTTGEVTGVDAIAKALDAECG